ncbi:hypothetical protein Syun_023686 [Stephania yunnanensis]|uniref:Uncharacterized protein n=1 Tax=Stephania yunnanensis TaxID=152371 RepID=A0AAP0FCS9_9MAGN
MTTLSAMARLLAIKSEHHISERGYNEIIEFMKDCLPNDNSLVENFYATKRLMRGLGLPVEKIDCCEDQCMIYWGVDLGLDPRSTDRLQRRRLELTQATPDQPVDDEAVYLNVEGECPKERVYGLGSLGRKNRRYADPGACTSQMPEMVPRAEFDIVVDQLGKVMAFMHQQFGMTMDGAGLSQPQPPPPPPPDQQQSPQIDPADPPQQGDNVEREAQECYIRLFEYEGVCPLCRGDVCEAMSRLQELALSLARKCLSFDFVGTFLDESSEEFGTVQVPSAWRPVLEDPSNLQIFFYYYAIAKPPISEELNCSEGAVGVNGSHGFRNLVGSVVHLLGFVGDAITSGEANIFLELCNLVLGHTEDHASMNSGK